MATLVLTAVGTALGGPIGAAAGYLLGEKIGDGALFGSKGPDGPRLQDLSVTTSTYGRPISRQFGAMRTAGTVIWSTDLTESKDTSGGGKGKPKTTTYSYSVSFAVALSSRPISSIGRIWADGKLLRGKSGDLKAGGSFRVYNGNGDQPLDPAISASEEEACPAFRNCAYVVFEDLEIGDFGNRIPSLTFEVFADEISQFSIAQFVDGPGLLGGGKSVPHILGMSDDGGPLRSTLRALHGLYPLQCIDQNGKLNVRIDSKDEPSREAALTTLTRFSSQNDRQAAALDRQRLHSQGAGPVALRYYDQNRDYQPGIQRAAGRAATNGELTIELGATMVASGARSTVNHSAQRAKWIGERIIWTVAELDPDIGPGSILNIPGESGIWKVREWEWSDEGVQMVLERVPPPSTSSLVSDTGAISPPLDELPWPTSLEVFELPPDGFSDALVPQIFAAASAGGSSWRGASLFLDRDGALQPLSTAIAKRNPVGFLTTPLGSSHAILFEPNATLEVELVGADINLGSVTMADIASGENKLLVGEEVLQFLNAEQIGPKRWRLTGLLRGRAGTEEFAHAGHEAGTRLLAIDDSIVALDPSRVPSSSVTSLAAVGFGDEEPVYARLKGAGASRRPLPPVHTWQELLPDGSWHLGWTRRARGQWLWSDNVDVALIEETERYLVGVGSVTVPTFSWYVSKPWLTLDAAIVSNLQADAPAAPLWVAQVGTFDRSAATLITLLSS